MTEKEQATFDLIDQPWIPCLRVADGQLIEIGIREALTRPSDYREISDPSPLVTVSLYRLLIAILHRSLNGPKSRAEWGEIWSGGWDTEIVSAYLDQWRHRFDLFDPKRPFYQTAEIEYEYQTAISGVVHGLTLGNYSTLFDHHSVNTPAALSPAEAARSIAGFMNFAPGGLLTYRSKHGERGPEFGSADAGLLTKSAVMLATGTTLRETLTLNLHHYAGHEGEPFDFDPALDLPAWERADPALGIDRHPDGLVDLLTWQSRRLRLRPEVLSSGAVVVRHTVRMKGDQLPDRGNLVDLETMVPFRKNPRATRNQPAWSELALRADRALWRDSSVLLQSSADEHQQPRVTRWLASLAGQGYLPRSERLSADLLGMCVDRANVFFWRRERLPLRLEYLEDRELYMVLRDGLDLASRVGELFEARSVSIPSKQSQRDGKVSSPLKVFAASLLSPGDPSRADPDAVRAQIASLAPGRIYWSRLEAPFTRFMIDLADAWNPDGYGEEAAAPVLKSWAMELRTAAWAAFNESIGALDASDRELKAIARSEQRMAWLLSQLTRSYIESKEEVEG